MLKVKEGIIFLQRILMEIEIIFKEPNGDLWT